MIPQTILMMDAHASFFFYKRINVVKNKNSTFNQETQEITLAFNKGWKRKRDNL